jgi:hypothetical protein
VRFLHEKPHSGEMFIEPDSPFCPLLFRLERNAEHFAQVVFVIFSFMCSINISCLRHFSNPALIGR